MLPRLPIPVLMLCLTVLYPAENKLYDYLPTPAAEKPVVTSIEILYQQLGEPDLPVAALKSSLGVYDLLVKEGQISNNKVITIIDFSQSSNRDRLFVIDIVSKKVLFKSLVAHGKNSGELYATSFSNDFQSHRSSLGYYLTGKPYVGRHGYSLTLEGIEKGINDNAEKRAVVIHGASYVSQQYIESYGRLGRSFGCPALPVEKASDIINTICERSLLFIYSQDENYNKKSSLFSSFLSRP